MIGTFIFIRLLNPKIMKNFQKSFVFWQIFEVWCFHQSSNLASVETFWWQAVTYKSGCLPAPEKGDISKNSDILQLVGRVPFLCAELVGLVQEILAMKGEFIKAFHKHRQEHYRGLSEGFLWHSTCQDNTIGRMWQVHVSAVMTRRTRFFRGTPAFPWKSEVGHLFYATSIARNSGKL